MTLAHSIFIWPISVLASNESPSFADDDGTLVIHGWAFQLLEYQGNDIGLTGR